MVSWREAPLQEARAQGEEVGRHSCLIAFDGSRPIPFGASIKTMATVLQPVAKREAAKSGND